MTFVQIALPWRQHPEWLIYHRVIFRQGKRLGWRTEGAIIARNHRGMGYLLSVAGKNIGPFSCVQCAKLTHDKFSTTIRSGNEYQFPWSDYLEERWATIQRY